MAGLRVHLPARLGSRLPASLLALATPAAAVVLVVSWVLALMFGGSYYSSSDPGGILVSALLAAAAWKLPSYRAWFLGGAALLSTVYVPDASPLGGLGGPGLPRLPAR